MSWASLNGDRVISGSVTVPSAGVWAADVLLAISSPIPTSCVLTLGDLVLRGTAVRAADFAGSRSVRLVGGGGGWRQAVTARAYQSPAGVPLSMILRDLALEVGEAVNVPVDYPVGTAFVREAGPASRVLRQLVGAAGWWMDPAGVTQVGPRLPGLIASDFTVIHYSGGKGTFEIATETLADWVPGRSFMGPTMSAPATISTVRHVLTNEGSSRLEVMTSASGADRLMAGFRELVRGESPGQTFLGTYEYRIQVVTGAPTASSVDATPTDPTLGLPGLSRLPLVPGTLGEGVLPVVGSTCLVQFVNGSPKRPIVTGGDPANPPAFANLLNGTKGAARDGDPCGFLIPGSGGASWSPTNPGGGIPMSITGGSSKLKVG